MKDVRKEGQKKKGNEEQQTEGREDAMDLGRKGGKTQRRTEGGKDKKEEGKEIGKEKTGNNFSIAVLFFSPAMDRGRNLQVQISLYPHYPDKENTSNSILFKNAVGLHIGALCKAS